MSHEVLEMVCEMDPNSLQRLMAMQCAPVITGEKISNLIMLNSGLNRQVYDFLKKTDLSFFSLLCTSKKSSVLVYSEQALQKVLRRQDIGRFLEEYGYEDLHVNAALLRLRERYIQCRLCGEEFPHEIGVFLGYPLEDIRGFIANSGENYLCKGFWTVYANPEEKKQTFRRFYASREMMIRLLHEGLSLYEIMEAYRGNRLGLAAGI